MNIQQVSDRLNDRAIEEGFKIAHLPELRKKYLGKKKLPSKIFTTQTIFPEYAFHHGGRDEMQFNFGEEYIDDTQWTRFALCLSLEPSHSLPNPVDDLDPLRKRFNQCIELHPDYFVGFEMWYYHKGVRSRNFSPNLITNEWFQYGNFISIGNIINKPIGKLNESDLTQILNCFDKLFPIYEFCVLQSTAELSIEKRISRLAFNTNGWIQPSGSYGKSPSKDSYEAQNGFGHEEWLFDVSKLINGYHYGFLEPVRKQHQAYAGKTYNVWLFTIDSKSKKRYWVGEIEKIEVIEKEEAEFAFKKYQELGWYSELEQQIEAADGNLTAFTNWHNHYVDLFNVRFKPEYLKVNDPYIELPENHPVINISRYNFTHFYDVFKIETDHEFTFLSGYNSESDDDSGIESKSHVRELKSIEITYLHNAISKKLTTFLRQKYGAANVVPEHPAGIVGNRIDIVVKSDTEGLTFYEIKTYNSIKTSIREAIGQLMEYAFYPDKNYASQLIILTQKHPEFDEEVSYVKFIRNKYKVPLYYQWYDYQTNTLSEKY